MTKTKGPKLKPCPFCGSSDMLIIDEHWEKLPKRNQMYYSVRCYHCRAKTGQEVTKKGAVKLWNHRAEPPNS